MLLFRPSFLPIFSSTVSSPSSTRGKMSASSSLLLSTSSPRSPTHHLLLGSHGSLQDYLPSELLDFVRSSESDVDSANQSYFSSANQSYKSDIDSANQSFKEPRSSRIKRQAIARGRWWRPRETVIRQEDGRVRDLTPVLDCRWNRPGSTTIPSWEEESRLWYWREDPVMNANHYYWHRVLNTVLLIALLELAQCAEHSSC